MDSGSTKAHLLLIYNVKESQEDSLVVAIVRGEKAVICFEFVWRQSIQSWYPCTVLVDSQIVDAAGENSNDKVYLLWKIHVIYYWQMNAIWFTAGGVKIAIRNGQSIQVMLN